MISPAELQALCDRIARLLCLKDWKIRARYAAAGEKLNPGSVGQLDWNYDAVRCEHHALIRIHPGRAHDHLVTLAHELAHIPLLPCPPRGKRQAQAQEEAIDSYARAIVSALRAA